MFSFETFKSKIGVNSEEKIKNVIFANWYGNTIKVVVILIIVIEFLSVLLRSVNAVVFLIIYVLLLLFVMFYLSTRKAGIALTENNIVCVIFRHIGLREKEVYEIPKNKIKYLSVYKLLYLRFIKLSFIDNTGRLKSKKLFFSTFMIIKDSNKFKMNGEEIFKELEIMQKILDKGDF